MEEKHWALPTSTETAYACEYYESYQIKFLSKLSSCNKNIYDYELVRKI